MTPFHADPRTRVGEWRALKGEGKGNCSPKTPPPPRAARRPLGREGVRC